MQSKQQAIQTIERLIAVATANKTFVTERQRLAYERGYLTGLLASLAHNDSSVAQVVYQRINNGANKAV